MARSVARVFAAFATSTALGALGVTGVSAAGAATQAAQQDRSPSLHAAQARATPGAQRWVQRYNGPADGYDSAESVAVSRRGDRVFVTGVSAGSSTGYDYATTAYNAVTGARLWVARYSGPGKSEDYGRVVAVSPNGHTVFVTGWSQTSPTNLNFDYATVAYNAATGARLWVARYNGPSNHNDQALSVAVSPDGARVYVTGASFSTTSADDYATVAYNAFTGAQVWVARYNGPGNFADVADAVAVSPDGHTVLVTGASDSSAIYYGSSDYATVAYNAATGTQMWVARYNGPGNFADSADSLAVSPDGARVYVTGGSRGATSLDDYATVAYKAATGAQLWVRRYNGPANRFDVARSVVVSPAGTVVVTGQSRGAISNEDYATVAYSVTGTKLWVARYNGPGNGSDFVRSAAAPGNGKVYVTGLSWGGSITRYDFATIAYSVFSGARLWLARYNGPPSSGDYAYSVAARAGRVFVTGPSHGINSNRDYATVAYNG